MERSGTNVLALAGGVGGAKLANGLARVLPASALRIVVNTGDDFEHLDLAISPDLDTVMYTLAGLNNTETGWGLAGETWEFMAALERLGGETWFRLGDRDLATHVERTRRLAAGESLSSITADFCRRLNIDHPLSPMTDGALRTIVQTPDGPLAFQDYFVRQQCAPKVTGVSFDRADGSMAPSQAFDAALADDTISAIIICPSNPWLSIAPILAVDGVAERLRAHRAPVIAVSPIVGDAAIKGPAAKIMTELGYETTVAGVAEYYRGLIDGLVIDNVDSGYAETLVGHGLHVLVTATVMRSVDDQVALAHAVLEFANHLSTKAGSA